MQQLSSTKVVDKAFARVYYSLMENTNGRRATRDAIKRNIKETVYELWMAEKPYSLTVGMSAANLHMVTPTVGVTGLNAYGYRTAFNEELKDLAAWLQSEYGFEVIS